MKPAPVKPTTTAPRSPMSARSLPAARHLARLRRHIDALDTALIELLSRRTSLSIEVARLKSRVGLPLRTPAREAEVLRQTRRAVTDPLTAPAAERIFRAILGEMRALQRMATGASG